jgi:hypothetical protein
MQETGFINVWACICNVCGMYRQYMINLWVSGWCMKYVWWMQEMSKLHVWIMYWAHLGDVHVMYGWHKGNVWVIYDVSFMCHVWDTKANVWEIHWVYLYDIWKMCIAYVCYISKRLGQTCRFTISEIFIDY